MISQAKVPVCPLGKGFYIECSQKLFFPCGTRNFGQAPHGLPNRILRRKLVVDLSMLTADLT